MSEDRQERFTAYVEALAEVIGHADRAEPLHDYCRGLMLPGERKSVEPIAAVTAPARVSAKHQSLLHFVANAPWSNERVLGRIQELTLPIFEGSGAIKAWIIDDTGFQRKVVTRSGWRVNIAVSSASRTTARWRSACRWPRCGQPAGCLAPVFAAGVDRRCGALRRGGRARDDRVSHQAGDRAGADPGGMRGWSAARGCADGSRVWHQYPAVQRQL